MFLSGSLDKQRSRGNETLYNDPPLLASYSVLQVADGSEYATFKQAPCFRKKETARQGVVSPACREILMKFD